MTTAAKRRDLRGAIAGALALASLTTPTAHSQNEASATGIENIIVTARRREESLQDVPIAITALTAEQLETQNVRTLEDLTAYAPNIKVNAGRATAARSMRTSAASVRTTRCGVSSPASASISTTCLHRATARRAARRLRRRARRILRGPQGTLYGKNTIAGAIKYVTRDIVGDPRIRRLCTGGSYNQLDGRSAVRRPDHREHLCRRCSCVPAARRLRRARR